jgi:hypoxanthine phosphoribosyltransferase
MLNDIEETLLTTEEIQNRVTELGKRISSDYGGRNLLMVSILKGSVVFMADLMRAVTIPVRIDFHVRLELRHRE